VYDPSAGDQNGRSERATRTGDQNGKSRIVMRIIAGRYKSRKLISPRGDSTRPIADRVKEALFNILRGHIEDEIFLDLFSGTGTIGLEALSRGARHVVFVERDRDAIGRLRRNIEALDCAPQCTVVEGDALSPACLARLPGAPHVVTLDPPYELLRTQEGIDLTLVQMERASECMDSAGYLVLRTEWPLHDREIPLSPRLEGPESHLYKTMALHLYQPRSD